MLADLLLVVKNEAEQVLPTENYNSLRSREFFGRVSIIFIVDPWLWDRSLSSRAITRRKLEWSEVLVPPQFLVLVWQPTFYCYGYHNRKQKLACGESSQ